ncbi:MAG: Holliday junction resolvase RuvX [Muribaculaceae bacterium]|nr:Holliday junction resolvase RuvX [Muribaculaceae bacterium]
MARIICIDYGRRRCGIAVTDELRLTANPLATVGAGEVLQYVLDYIAANRVDLVIVGKPTTLRGEPSESWTYIEPFTRALAKRLPRGVALKLYDERFTSAIAHQAMIDGGLRRNARRDKATVDRMAATIILTDYLQSIYNRL